MQLPQHGPTSQSDPPTGRFAPPPDDAPLREKVEHVLKQVYDPEIPVSIYELGLIYEVNITEEDDGARVSVVMTLTTPNCPEAQTLPQIVQGSVEGLDEVKQCEVHITWEPMWTRDMMSEEAKFVLGLI